MEVAHQCRRKGLALRANWVPRLENQEADDLTNLDFKSFDPKRRIEVDLTKLRFGVLNKLFAEGDRYVEELATLKAKSKEMAAAAGPRKKRLAGESLREKDPW